MSELKIRRKAIARVKNLLPVPVKYHFLWWECTDWYGCMVIAE